jgi:hypothetical protein
MNTVPLSRRILAAAFGLALAATLLSSVTPADELWTGGAARGFVIHGPLETLQQYCKSDSQGTLWLELPGGSRFELVTSPYDSGVANPGDGSFHPFDEAEVRAALAQVKYPLEGIHADVFLLPYPRRRGLDSAAGQELILLAPGVRPIPSEQQHSQFTHELGHVIQYALMPDHDSEQWQRYRRLRGITDESVYSAASMHADRPHEIFAEDFRALFGGASANYSGSIENSTLLEPERVAGLASFMEGLLGTARPRVSLAGFPNPSRGAMRFTRSGGVAAPLELFDAAGRRIASLQPQSIPGGWEYLWNGREGAGRRPTPGVVFARVRGAADPAVRVTVLP